MKRREFIVVAGGAALWPLAPQAQQPGDRSRLQPAPTAVVPPLLKRADIDHAVSQLNPVIKSAMERTGVPGLAVVAVYKDAAVYAQGFGVREVGTTDPVDTDTVFLLASASKPIASTVVATLVGRRRIDWNDPVRKFDPGSRSPIPMSRNTRPSPTCSPSGRG